MYRIAHRKIGYHKQIMHQYMSEKFLCQGAVNPVEISSYPVWSCCKIWLMCRIWWPYVRGPETISGTWSPSPWDMFAHDLLAIYPDPTSAEFGNCRSNRMDISRLNFRVYNVHKCYHIPFGHWVWNSYIFGIPDPSFLLSILIGLQRLLKAVYCLALLSIFIPKKLILFKFECNSGGVEKNYTWRPPSR